MLLEFFIWWYSKGWSEAAHRSQAQVKNTLRGFSISKILRTLFAPWRQIISLPGRSIDDKMRSLIDNLVSRTVGFFVRVFTLIAALVLTAFIATWGLALTICWPLIPIAIIYCLFRGIAG